MKKTRKWICRMLSCFLLAALLLGCVLTGCKKEPEPPVTEPPAGQENIDPMPDAEAGMTFSTAVRYLPGEMLAAMPVSFEAVLRIPADVTEVDGVLFGNDDGHAAGISYELSASGNPVVRWRDADGTAFVSTFDQVDVRGGAQVRLNLVWSVDDGSLACYLDGVLKQTVTQVPSASYAPTQRFVLGTDMVTSGMRPFCGILKSVAVWQDERTAQELAAGGVDGTDTALLLAYDLTDADEPMADLSTHRNDLIGEWLWLDVSAVKDVGEYAYSFAIIGDMSGMMGLHANRVPLLYDWLLSNKETQKIQHVFALGGITAQNRAEEWSAAGAQYGRLDGQLSYSLVRGEQDGAQDFTAAFGTGAYADRLAGSFAVGDVINTYQKLTVGEHKYLIMTLDVGASDEVLDWAGSVIAANSDHKVILTTHIYQYRDGTTLDGGDAAPATDYVTGGNNGDVILEKLVSKHENILLVLSSHDAWQNVVCSQITGEHGNTVTQLMVSPQGMDTHISATGMVAMLYFDADGERITVRYYSTVRAQYGAETSQFTVDLTPSPAA